MKKVLFVIVGMVLIVGVLGLIIGDVEEICDGNYVLLKLKYDAGEFEILEKSVESGCSPKNHFPFVYDYKLIDEEQVYYEGDFNPDIIFVDNVVEEEMEGGALEIKEAEIYLAVPYIKDVDNIEIYKGDNLKLSESVFDAGATSCRIE